MKKQIKFKKNLILKRIIFLIILLLTCIVIFKFSSQNGIESSSVSRKVTEYFVELVSRIKVMNEGTKMMYITRLEPYVRKLAHFSIYMVVGFSIMGFFCTFDMRNKYKLLWSLLIGITYAITDEYHQSFIPGRSPRVFDVCIDTFGVLIGIFVMIFIIIIVEIFIDWLKR